MNSTDFALSTNKAIWQCIDNIYNDENCTGFDTDTIRIKAKLLGLEEHFKNKKELEYLELLNASNFSKENLPTFAIQVKKLSVVRDLHQRYKDASSYIENIKGTESLSDIIATAEGQIVDFVTGIDSGNQLKNLSNNIEEYVELMLEREEVDQIGIPTGFPLWDNAIGGGLRRGTISVIAARPKQGKSLMALNMARNIAKRQIPVLYLDTELTESYQKDRLLSLTSGCPIRKLETGKFKHYNELIEKLRNAGKEIKDYKFYYESIAGMSHTEALALARRWIVKNVGFNENGEANDCVIIYDYMKLTSGNQLTKVTPEYILLGLMLTDMHNFAVKYSVPFLGFVQVNREGIDNDDTSIIAGSDRILWLCSNMSVMRNKDETDIEMGSSWESGNKKLSVLETRHGAGLSYDNDYINLHAMLKPKISEEEGTGHIREGLMHSDIVGKHVNENQSPIN